MLLSFSLSCMLVLILFKVVKHLHLWMQSKSAKIEMNDTKLFFILCAGVDPVQTRLSLCAFVDNV